MRKTPLSESAIAEAERLSLEAICQEDEATQSRFFAEARSALRGALVAEPNNPSLHHMLGLCWYDDPARSDKIRQAIEFHFKAANQLAPSDPLSPGDVADSELEAVCLAYQKADEEERPVPLEIATCVATLTKISQGKKRAMVGKIIGLIRSLGYENAFLARSDYQHLKQSLL